MADKAPEGSQLATLLQRRQQIADEQVLKLRIPRWDEPEIVVSYRPVDPTEFAKSLKGLEGLKEPGEIAEASLDRNADLLIKSCLGIESKNPDHKWEGFNEELAEALGIEIPTARRTCRQLFVTGGDLLATASKLCEWSGIANQTVAEGFSGE